MKEIIEMDGIKVSDVEREIRKLIRILSAEKVAIVKEYAQYLLDAPGDLYMQPGEWLASHR